ncbi:MAG: PIN domain-containing protein [Phaeodactylibacter sp.]|nr:PIN domain-containing protein [Phaeodactylibacter sp.]
MTDVLLDTNILIYALDKGNPFHHDAVTLISDPSLNFFIATKNISEYFAVCSKLGIPLPKAYGFYLQVCQNTQILYPDHQSLSVFEQLLQKYQPTGNRVYDMEIVSVAIVHQIPEVAKVNVKDFSGISEIKVRPIR